MFLEPIGFLESCFPEKFGTPRQPGLVSEAWALLEIDRKWQPEEALQGLEDFSHVWLIFGFHKNTNERYHAKVHPPRLAGESIGVFATRSPHRPNALGLSLVKVEAIQKNVIQFSGVDLITGTPIYDIKPYLPEIECRPEARSGWTQDVRPQNRKVSWTQDQLGKLESWGLELNQRGMQMNASVLKGLIESTLCLDPRPVVYRGFEGQEAQAKYRTQHAVRIFDGDIHFRFTSPNEIEVLDISKYAKNE